jgi:hypothetical protein
MRGTAWEPRVVRAASVGVVVMALAWFVERVFFVS